MTSRCKTVGMNCMEYSGVWLFVTSEKGIEPERKYASPYVGTRKCLEVSSPLWVDVDMRVSHKSRTQEIVRHFTSSRRLFHTAHSSEGHNLLPIRPKL